MKLIFTHLDPVVKMFLNQINFYEGILLSRWIEQPVLQDDIAIEASVSIQAPDVVCPRYCHTVILSSTHA
jgi:hypothetical protein